MTKVREYVCRHIGPNHDSGGVSNHSQGEKEISTSIGRWIAIAAIMLSCTATTSANNDAKGKGAQAANHTQAVNHTQAAKTDVTVKLAAPLDAEQKRTLSTSAVRLLRHVDDARKAVNGQDKTAALREIDQAITLSKIIQKTAPRYAVTTTIKVGGINYKDQDQIRGTLVTLYDELEKVSFIGPIEAAKRQSAKVAQTGAPTAVTNVDRRRTRVLFDTSGAQPHLDAARQAVNKGDWNRADTALLGVQNGVIFEYAEADEPLMEARESLRVCNGSGVDGARVVDRRRPGAVLVVHVLEAREPWLPACAVRRRAEAKAEAR